MLDEEKVRIAMEEYKKQMESLDDEQLLKELVNKYSESCEGWTRAKIVVEQEWQIAKKETLRRMKQGREGTDVKA